MSLFSKKVNDINLNDRLQMQNDTRIKSAARFSHSFTTYELSIPIVLRDNGSIVSVQDSN